MKREDLIKLGITEELVEKIMALHGQDIESHKTRLTAAQTELDGVKKQLAEAGTTIEGFKKLDVEGIKRAADEWKVKAEQAQTEAAQQVAQLRFDHALEQALAAAKAKDPVSVRAHLKTDLLKLADDGTISGLTEQLDKLKTDRDYLFESETAAPKIVTGGNPQPVTGNSFMAALRRGAQLPEGK